MDTKQLILKELLDTSSSSDEEEFFIHLQSKETLHRVQNFVENVIQKYSNVDFQKNFRVSRASAEYLTERYSNSYAKRSYQGGRLPTSAETQMLSFLWFSGNKTTIREVANLFGMSYSNVHRTFNNVLNFITSDIAPEVIHFPISCEEKQTIANDFKMISGIPNILGCIDGSFITVRTPKHKIRSTYSNRHDGISITLQAVCDSKLRFLDVFTGIPSKIHDSRVLKMSFIGKELSGLCSGGYYLLGDAAYPLREYLITPYRNYGSLSHSQKNFNTHFSRARVKIENSFCLLKCRFRQLMRLDFYNVEQMAKFVIACCALHNICINRSDELPEDIINTELRNENDEWGTLESEKRDNLLTQLGRIKRDEIKNYLATI